MENGINVLSLFDGLSGGMVALERAGIKVNKYFASEIDKYAIKISHKKYPDIIHIGDIKKVRYENGTLYSERGTYEVDFDIVMGGSPCQGFSIAGKQLNFDDPRSKLYFEWLRIAHEVNAPYFFLENVKMKKVFQDVITDHLGVEPILLNSNLVSAQNRLRTYWTNIPGYEVPEDRGILLKDIVHENVDIRLSAVAVNGKAHCLTANYTKHSGPVDIMKSYTNSNGPVLFEEIMSYIIDPEKIIGNCEVKPSKTNNVVTINPRFENGKQTYQQQRVYETDGKFPAITAELSGRFNIVQLNKYLVPFDKTLHILDKEIERGKIGYFKTDSQANRVYFIHDKAVTLMGDAGGGAAKMGQYLFGCVTPDMLNKKQNGQRFSKGHKFYTLTTGAQHGILIEGYIRKLSPIECERLQGLPDHYSSGVSDSQRYKMLGNGWQIDSIVCFFKGLRKDLELQDEINQF